MKRQSALSLILLLVVFTVACSDDDNPVAPTVDVEPPTVPTITETFTGQLVLGSSSCHFFDVAQPGNVEMSITSIAPLETLTVGLGLGLPDEAAETGCVLAVTDNSVRKDETFLSAVGIAGEHCVCVFDVGNIFADQTVTYSLDVEHP